jgi:hypothetical protein
VENGAVKKRTVSTVSPRASKAETAGSSALPSFTGLKPGVNESCKNLIWRSYADLGLATAEPLNKNHKLLTINE